MADGRDDEDSAGGALHAAFERTLLVGVVCMCDWTGRVGEPHLARHRCGNVHSFNCDASSAVAGSRAPLRCITVCSEGVANGVGGEVSAGGLGEVFISTDLPQPANGTSRSLPLPQSRGFFFAEIAPECVGATLVLLLLPRMLLCVQAGQSAQATSG